MQMLVSFYARKMLSTIMDAVSLSQLKNTDAEYDNLMGRLFEGTLEGIFGRKLPRKREGRMGLLQIGKTDMVQCCSMWQQVFVVNAGEESHAAARSDAAVSAEEENEFVVSAEGNADMTQQH
ncbi:hypothetical protein VNO80_21540 [Phaseolus coccineus]|uniref:Uncharacterized protein n=1 Tax=Phaseolus coccineus TaxID=3886 RepID=A0AAN9QU59_PHACN